MPDQALGILRGADPLAGMRHSGALERPDGGRQLLGDLRVQGRDVPFRAILVRAVQDEAAASCRSVSLHVAMGNPAAGLYDRLGFRLVDDLGVYRLLEWRPS